MIAIPLEEKIRHCIERHPDWDNVRMANSVGTRTRNIVAFREGKPLTVPVDIPIASTANPTPIAESGLIPLDKVLQRYDIRAAILRELALIPKGKFISETELCQRAAGTDKNRFRRAVDNNEVEFKPLRIKIRPKDLSEDRWYWGHPDDIAKVLEMRDK
jgi:hypothetical protein